MKYCDGRGTSYRNGNSYEDCKKIAEDINTKLKPLINDNGSMSWKQLSDEVDHDELVYKLVLKYLRRDGFDIGNSNNPKINVKSN
jgi:hydroxymethylpyrimidine pyrophosphatase-like HAD family hydrolase